MPCNLWCRLPPRLSEAAIRPTNYGTNISCSLLCTKLFHYYRTAEAIFTDTDVRNILRLRVVILTMAVVRNICSLTYNIILRSRKISRRPKIFQSGPSWRASRSSFFYVKVRYIVFHCEHVLLIYEVVLSCVGSPIPRAILTKAYSQGSYTAKTMAIHCNSCMSMVVAIVQLPYNTKTWHTAVLSSPRLHVPKTHGSWCYHLAYPVNTSFGSWTTRREKQQKVVWEVWSPGHLRLYFPQVHDSLWSVNHLESIPNRPLLPSYCRALLQVISGIWVTNYTMYC